MNKDRRDFFTRLEILQLFYENILLTGEWRRENIIYLVHYNIFLYVRGYFCEQAWKQKDSFR